MTNKIEEIISKNTKLFIEEIKRISNSRAIRPPLDFEIFSDENDVNLRDQIFYSHFIDRCVRDILVISMIKDFCDYYGVDCQCLHSERYVFSKEGSVKALYDKYNDYVFKINDSLYRFTNTYPYNYSFENAAEEIKEKYSVSKIYKLVFIKNTSQQLSNEKTLKEFFVEYFSDDIYEKYLTAVKDIIKKANEIIGYSTVKNLSSWKELEAFNERLINNLISYNYEKGYIFKDSRYTVDFSENDSSILHNTFIKNEKYSLLLSETDFSKCFATAEFLYASTQKQNRFDYTAIVFDYYKAVELLVSFIIESNRKGRYIDFYKFCARKDKDCTECEYKKTCNQSSDKPYFIISKKDNNYRLELMVDDLLLNESLQVLSKEGIKNIEECLYDYRKTCRNGYIHKDPLFDREEVNRIRHNTWMCLYYLLGGFVLPNSDKIAVYSYRYSSLYRLLKINGWATGHFLIIKDGKEIKVVWDFENRISNTKYDKDTGTVLNSLVFFVTDDYKIDPNDFDEEGKKTFKKMTINAKNLPDAMYWVYKDYRTNTYVKKPVFDKEHCYLDYDTLFGDPV